LFQGLPIDGQSSAGTENYHIKIFPIFNYVRFMDDTEIRHIGDQIGLGEDEALDYDNDKHRHQKGPWYFIRIENR
jgi:hypothetical protein